MIDFQAAFESLKKYTGNNPERLWLARENPDLKKTVQKLGQLMQQISSSMPQLSQRYEPNVPRGFKETLDDYVSRYHEPVAKLHEEFSRVNLVELVKVSPEKSLVTENRSRKGWEPDEFDRDFDNAGYCLWELFSRLEERTIFIEDGRPDDPDWENLVNVALGAWDYLRMQGVDLYEISERLKKLPFFLIGEEISRDYTDSTKLSLFSLLQNAIQAYVCGAPLAAAAMCRAIGELVLKRHYGLDFSAKAQLKEIIKKVEKKFPQLQQHELYTTYDRVNEILHAADRIDGVGGISPEDEDFILALFRKTRIVIDEVPL
ncbi:MAG TPA: hypothetical protein VGB27_00050 [Candidatus Binatia bacterium]